MCLSHTPDNVFWAREQGINLVLCGHVHGGQIRLPFIGSIFVPSIYGRQFDMGVFEANETVMVVGRGLAGKEPLRFRCNPQVIRLTLRGFAS
jgi:predicted MPP superfamily phosphohydrolase